MITNRLRGPLVAGGALLAVLTQRVPSLTGQPPVGDPIYRTRRTAAMAALAHRILIVPSRSSFMFDDQPGFQQAPDFQYLTALNHLVGAVLVLDGPTRSTVLFLPRPNPVVNRPFPTPDRTSASRLQLDAVLPIDSLELWVRRHWAAASAILVSPTDTRGAVAIPPPMANGVVRWSHYLGGLGWKGAVGSAVTVLRPLRDIKDQGEIAILERVGRLSAQAMLVGMRALRPGRRQRDAALPVIAACVTGGGRQSFWPWLMSGPRAVFTELFDFFVDYEGHDRVMRAGELTRVDVGCQLDHYMGDVGRTAPVDGRFDAGQREAWDLFVAGYRAGLTVLRDGVEVAAVYRAALARVRELSPRLTTTLGRLAADTLLGRGGTDAWEIHGVGLDDAEGQPPVLRAGMTVAYELMFAVRGQGFYLEDMILIEPHGYRLLTPGLPYAAAEIEAAMTAR